MILIFGGSYQGKLSYVLERYNLTSGDAHYCDYENTIIPENKTVIYEIDKWVLALIRAKADVQTELAAFINNNPQAIVICNDISCGIVPFEAEQRLWREMVGRFMAELSFKSDEVIRLFCGIPTKIK